MFAQSDGHNGNGNGASNDSSTESESDLKTPGLSLFRQMAEKRKTLKSIMEESLRDHDVGGAKFTLFDLLCIGIGSTIGSGVFVLTGKALPAAGPGAIVSWLLAGLVCLLSSVAYMELSARLPTKGSCYVFSYHGLGELAGVIGSVCLTMEYGISGSGVARSWSAKVYRATGHWFVACYNGQKAPSPGCNDSDDYYFDPLALVMTILCTGIVVAGTALGKVVINVFTLAKILLVMFMIVAGLTWFNGEIFEAPDAFFPVGPSGVLSATSMLFFGFVGFDEVCCMASKAHNPTYTMPRALAGTLLGAALLSGMAQLALSMMVEWTPGMESTPFELAFHEKGWAWARWLVASGELVLLPLVVFLSILPQPEVTAAMSEDGLLPSLFSRQSRNGVYIRGTVFLGVFLSLAAAAVPFVVLWDIISMGVLFSFNLTNAALVNVRYGNGGALQDPWVNTFVWIMLGCAAIAGYTLNLGVAAPLMDKDVEVDVGMLVVGLVALAGLATVACVLRFFYEMRGHKTDAEIFQAFGVPFVPACAMFFNFFLIATLPMKSLGYFAAFVVFTVAVYATYIFIKRDRSIGGGHSHDVDGSEESSRDEGHME